VSGGGEFTIVTAENSISSETWHHLALTYDGSNIILYIDGIVAGSAEASGQITNDSVPLNIGKLVWQTTNFDLDGQADEISLWNIALTQQQVQDYMEADLTGETGLVGYWNFNEGSGETANDASGNDNHGTIYGATWSTNVPFQQTYSGPVWHVATTGSDETGNGSETNPFATIQKAYNHSKEINNYNSTGHVDTILVHDGTYNSNIEVDEPFCFWDYNCSENNGGLDDYNWIIKSENGAEHTKINGPAEITLNYVQIFFEGFHFEEINISGYHEGSYRGMNFENCVLINNNGELNRMDFYYSTLVDNSLIINQGIIENSIILDNEGLTVDGESISYTLNDLGFNENGNISDVNPLFCDPENGDYTLAANSPALGSGEGGANMGAFGVGCPIQVDWDFSLSEPVIEVMGTDNVWNPGDTISVEMDFCNNTDVAHNWYPGVTIESDSSLTSLHSGHIWFYAMFADTCHTISFSVLANSSIIADTIVAFRAYPEALNCQNQPEYCIDGDTLTFEVPIVVQVVSAEPEHFIPEVFTLHQNHPNPFNPVTTLRYDLPEDGLVNITIYDMMGRVVKTLINDQQTAGYRSTQWDATNDAGSPVSAGVYLYSIEAGEFRQTKKMILLK
jgi:hypothetical protein